MTDSETLPAKSIVRNRPVWTKYEMSYRTQLQAVDPPGSLAMLTKEVIELLPTPCQKRARDTAQ